MRPHLIAAPTLGLVNRVLPLPGTPSAPALPRLGVPARRCWGAADQFQKIGYGERLARDLSAPLRRIEGGKHFTPEDHPDIIATEINALIATVAARQAEPKG